MSPTRILRRVSAAPRLFPVLVALAAGIALAAAVVPAGAGTWKGQETQKDGSLYVTNPATGMEAPAMVDLKELWRLGGESEDENEFFGVIVRITTDPKGNIYVLDGQLSEVKVYDSSGKFLKKIGSFAKLDRTLEFANLVIDEKRFGTWEQGGRWDASADGRVYVALGDNYEITVFNPDGSKDRVIQRDCQHYQRNAEESAEVKGIYEAFTKRAPNAKVEVNAFDADVGALYPREDGSLWVLSSHGMRKQPKGTVGVFDVFDGKGRFVRQVTLRGQGDPRKDGYFFVGDRLYVVTGFLDALIATVGGGEKKAEDADATPMELICYRVEAPMLAKGN